MDVALTPLEFARRARALYSDREALVDGALRLSYQQFFARCDRWSAALKTLGVGQGDRVAYIAPNTHAQLESFYGVPQIGAVLVPINYRLSADEFEFIINHSGATVVCAHEDYLECVDGIRARLPGVRHFVALEGSRAGWLDYEQLLAAAPAECPPPAIEESDLLTINYTSGTTSRPKGVMITHRNAYMNVVGTLLHLPMQPADRYLWTLPMFHANGWTFVWAVTAVGAGHVCLRRVEPLRIFELISSESVSMFCAAPTVLIGVASAPAEVRAGAPRGLRVVTAGAPPAAATIERVENELGWTITQVYGLTETAPFITVCEPRPEHDALSPADRAVIKARQGVELITSGELRVVDEGMHDVPRDGQTVGEIVVRGNVVMKGYYNDPDATEQAFGGGYFHSGDAAVVHPDGYVEIRDRLKDVIISGGENISSVEVEGVLLRHAAVQEAAVVGMPDTRWGEAPHAFIVLKQGAACTPDELRAHTRERLAHFKCPHSFTFVSELPKTATGKIQKFVLRGRKSAIATQ
ncbi:MAG TPA: long-chain-fatty-acid--CoA ligase [Vicinamibacterales bacterium]|nr:long-chain-fatty-acid--CoA ligase [Vicinamibacterales bacterium]